jgi:hypothetical protein
MKKKLKSAYVVVILLKVRKMSIDSTSIPYEDRNFIVDDSDKELFVMMKSIVDTGFPEAVDPMMLELYKVLWSKKRKLAYEELENGSIYIHFPKINPLVRLLGTLLMPFTSKEDEDEK